MATNGEDVTLMGNLYKIKNQLDPVRRGQYRGNVVGFMCEVISTGKK